MPVTSNHGTTIGTWPGSQQAAVSRCIEVGQGDHCVSREPDLTMTATLGSCVAVILFDSLSRTCGMTHIFRCVDPGPTGGAAVVAEIEKLVNGLMQAGSPRTSLEGRLVGGAKTLARGRDVGADIARVCLDYLKAERIPLTFSDLGGTKPRRIRLVATTCTLTIDHPRLPMPRITPPSHVSSKDDTELF